MPKIGSKLYTKETYDYITKKKMLDFFNNGTQWASPKDSIRLNLYHHRDAIFDLLGNGCSICGDKSNLQLDHIIPLYKNGTNELNNLQILCMYHHKIKTINDKRGSQLFGDVR
jgi:5-methylcytosine-specific restriction endonuclease McrA